MKYVRTWGRLGMKYNWSIKKFSDIAYINPKESIPKGTIAKKIPMDKLQPFCRDIPEYILEKFNGGSKFRNEDTIMARITPCLENGKTAKVNILENNEIGFGSTEYIVFRAIDGISDSNYLYYLICSPFVRNPAIKSMVGSSGRQRVQTDVIKNLQLEIPPLDEQKKIGNLLKCIDDKIELNIKMNRNLEQQAATLYIKYFSPSINSNANEVTLDKFCLIFTGKKNSNAATFNGKYKFFTCSPDALQIDSYIYDGNAIIISGNGAYTGRTRFYSGKFDLYQRTYACTLKDDYNQDYIFLLYWFVKFNLSNKIMGGTRGSAIPYIVMTDLTKFKFEFNKKKFENYIPLFKSITKQIQANEQENEKLTIIRDTLLPKLISGELNISNINF